MVTPFSSSPESPHCSRRSIGAALLVAVGGTLIPAGRALAAPPSTGIRQGPTTAGVAQTSTVAQTPAAAQASTVAARPTLRQGSHGATVKQLQQRLVALHYDLGAVDGIFGSETYHAVVAFQKVNNLARDGIVGSRTWAAIDRPATPRVRYRHSGYAVEVSLSKQVVYLTRQGAVVRILNSSTGKASTPTPTGNFTVLRRIDGWRQSPLGLLWRPNYFHGGYAVHGSTSVPNYPASHGCVRVTVPAINRLWTILRVKTPVHLYR